MSKTAVESVLRKAMSDEKFRASLKRDPDSALKGYDLTAEERAAAVASGSTAQLKEMGIDERITKSAILPGHGPDRG